MKFFVASSNPVKINAVKLAVAEKFPNATVQGLEVPSDVAAQPLSDEETKQGAVNRARNLRQLLLDTKKIRVDEEVLCLGLEGGVFAPQPAQKPPQLWSTVWVTALDQSDQLYLSNGARFPLPEFLSEMLLAGQEMGPGLGKLVGEENLRQKAGMIGYLTKNFTNRTDEYACIAKVTIGLWYGANKS